MKRSNQSKSKHDGKTQTITSMFKRQSHSKATCKSKSEANSSNFEEDVILIEDDCTSSPYFKKKTPSSKGTVLNEETDCSDKKSLSQREHTPPKYCEKASPSGQSNRLLPKRRKLSLIKEANSKRTDETVQVEDITAIDMDDSGIASGANVAQADESDIEDARRVSQKSSRSCNAWDDSAPLESIHNEVSANDNNKLKVERESLCEKSVDKNLVSAADKEIDCVKSNSSLKEQNVQAPEESGDEVKVSENNVFRIPYYLQNFETILTGVMKDEMNKELFDASDTEVIESYSSLTEAAKKLYIRLFSRKLNWIPLSKLNYPEIGEDLHPVLAELCSTKLVDDETNLTNLEEVLNALTAADIKTLAKSYHLSPSLTQKPQIVQELVKKSQQSTVGSMFGLSKASLGDSMLKKAKSYISATYRLRSEARAIFVRVMMLFSLLDTSGDEESGNGGQGQLFQMLMVNMGKVIYPTYKIHKVHRIFKNREDVIRFEKALQLESDLLHCTERGQWEEAYHVYETVRKEKNTLENDTEIKEWDKNLPIFLRPYTATSVIYRLLNIGVEILQRRKDFPAAVSLLRELLSQDVYCCTYRGHWWERLALNLDAHLKQPLQALEAVSRGLSDQHVKVGHRDALYLRAEAVCQRPKLKLKQKLADFQHEPVRETPKVYLEGRVIHQGVMTSGTRFVLDQEDGTEDMTVVGVEEFVLHHYLNHGFTSGIHAEGSIVGCLFALFFWDIILQDVPDAFHSPFQALPLDLSSDAFYQNRKEAIDQRLDTLKTSSVEDLHSMASETWTQHEGVLLAGMNWEKMRSFDFVKGLISCMGGPVLSGVLGRVAKCHRHTRSGFPDLTLWNVDTGSLKICEVKGPNDRLSNKQILWIDYLLSLGVDAEVCHVKAVAAKKLTK